MGSPAGRAAARPSRGRPRHAVGRPPGARALDDAALRLTRVLVAVAVVPGPPAFVPELMGRAVHELDGLRAAADTALTALTDELSAAQQANGAPGLLVVAGPGGPGEHQAAGPVGFGEFGLDVELPALPGGPTGAADALPTPLLVGRYLASRVTGRAEDVDRLWAGARWATVDAVSGTALGIELAASPAPVALLLVADGAACHGPKAPRAEDSRAGAYDDAVNEALAAADVAALRALDPDLGAALSATGPQLWPLLEAAATDGHWTGTLLHRGAPYGVGWTVALWRRAEAARAVVRDSARVRQQHDL